MPLCLPHYLESEIVARTLPASSPHRGGALRKQPYPCGLGEGAEEDYRGRGTLFDASRRRPITSGVTGFVYFLISNQRTPSGWGEGSAPGKQAGRGRQHILFHTLGFHSWNVAASFSVSPAGWVLQAFFLLLLLQVLETFRYRWGL